MSECWAAVDNLAVASPLASTVPPRAALAIVDRARAAVRARG